MTDNLACGCVVARLIVAANTLFLATMNKFLLSRNGSQLGFPLISSRICWPIGNMVPTVSERGLRILRRPVKICGIQHLSIIWVAYLHHLGSISPPSSVFLFLSFLLEILLESETLGFFLLKSVYWVLYNFLGRCEHLFSSYIAPMTGQRNDCIQV